MPGQLAFREVRHGFLEKVVKAATRLRIQGSGVMKEPYSRVRQPKRTITPPTR
jgi:hypothetical protein